MSEDDIAVSEEGQGRGPGFVTYTKDTFEEVRQQHNIMVLVGNGFDLQVLHEYDRPVDSRYEPFYYHLKMRGFGSDNLIVEHMETELRSGRQNWSDVEAAVAAAVNAHELDADRIFNDLRLIQGEFAEFLQGVVPSALLGEVGQDATSNKWSVRSLSEFLYDITDADEFRAMSFPYSAAAHYGLFNFLFVNFNYTTLLDNYIFLDQGQFNPREHRTVDTNSWFRQDPRGYQHPDNVRDDGQSGYLLADVVHPHGVLSTPRSLLFGIDAQDDYDRGQDPENKLKKPYWAQSNVLYRGHFDQTELFIIFGCSLGDSDGWWWRHIVGALLGGGSELIIYWRQDGDQNPTPESVKERFLKIGGADVSEPSALKSVKGRIYVVIYEDSTERIFLSTKRAEQTSTR